ncbi:MAG: lipoyl(octanoyl) transferase LipB [Desulfobacteraceae bacterium]
MKKTVMEIVDLGLKDYQETFDLQEKIVSEKIGKTMERDTVLVVEHPAVFTLGKNGGRENLVVSEAFLRSKEIPVVQTGRGGNITFHGPGQLVVYPIVDLKQAKVGVADFVYRLEEIMLYTALQFNVKAVRNGQNHGIWVNNSKLGSVGLSIRKNVSFHGIALNVNLDLTPFSWINPCGMSGVAMTSIEQEQKKSGSGDTVTMDRAKETMINRIKQWETV